VKITDVEVAYLKIPSITVESNGTQDTAVILVHTDEGITGVGEVDSAPTVVKAIIEAPRSHSLITGLREVLIGADPLEIEELWRQMYRATVYYGRRSVAIHAISGIDIALWDIKGKARNQPLCEMLGGSTATRVRAYASALFGADGLESGEKAARFKEAGFTAFKFGWRGFGQDERIDREHIEAIRAAVGHEAPVMIDAGWGRDSGGPEWNAATALSRAEMLADYDVQWLEEPLHPDDLTGYAELSAQSPVQIAAGEQLATVHEFRDLIERGGVHVLQPDISRAGGITETMRIAALALSRGRPVVPHNFKTGILGAATLHVNASIPNRMFHETPAPGEGSVLNTDLVHPRFELGGEGHCVIPTGPGLGIELDQEVFEQYRVT
jgi:L-rhamnonate dehydratase